MLEIPEQTRTRRRAVAAFILLALSFSACATKEKPPLVSDGRDGAESSLPWNSQEKWEGQGQLGEMAERFNSR